MSVDRVRRSRLTNEDETANKTHGRLMDRKSRTARTLNSVHPGFGRGRSVTLLLLVVSTAAIAFWPGLSGRFVNWDDDRNFEQNTAFRGLGGPQLRWAWSTHHLGVWQPAAWMLLGLEYDLFGLHPVGYHATSLVLHGLNTIILYWLILELLCKGMKTKSSADGFQSRLCAAAAALLFAVHPLRVEAVTWISCQPYLPAVSCYLVATLIYLRGYRDAKRARYQAVCMAGVFGLYLFAVLFTAVAVTLPVVLLILDVWPLRRWRRPGASRVVILVEKLPFFAVAAIVSASAVVERDYGVSQSPLSKLNLTARTSQAMSGLWFYIIKTIVPTGLSPFYLLPPDLGLATARFALAAFATAIITTFAVVLRRRAPGLLT